MTKSIVVTTLFFLIWQAPLFAQNVIVKTLTLSPISCDFEKDKSSIPVSFSREKLLAVNENVSEYSRIPSGFLKKMEIDPERKSRIVRRALIGLGVGAVFGGALGALAGGGFGTCYVIDPPPEGVKNRCSGIFAVVGAAGFGLLGGVIGAISGTVSSSDNDRGELHLYEQR